MILNNCRLVPELSSGISTEFGSVEIQNGKIISIIDTPSEQPDAYDCKGMTLLPGLIDLHTHITVLNNVGFDKLHTHMGMLTTASRHAAQYLDNGFTTIRDCGSIYRAANHVRTLVNDGLLDAPDIISCGLGLMTTDVEEDHPMSHHLSFADGTQEILKATRREIAEGADFVKVFASGAAANPNGVPAQAIITREELQTIVDASTAKGKYVAAHCHSDAAIRLCAETGVRTIEHATLMTEETLEYVASKQNIYLIPTLAVMYISEGPRKAYWEQRLGPMFKNCTRMMNHAYTMGLKLGFGTDCCAGDYTYEHGIEFKFRKENCGMKDIDILLQATQNNAEIAGINQMVGTIKEGLKANLILVDGKPDQDISCMYQKPYAVWKNGKLVR